MSGLAFAPRLDPAAIRPVFEKFGRLHVPDILAPGDAQALHAALAHTPWTRTFVVSGKGYRVALDEYAKSPSEVREQVEAAIAEGGRTGFQYDFDNWAVSDDLEVGQRRGGAVAAIEGFWDLMNSEAGLAALRKLTGEPRIAYVDAQASRYRAGQFLTAHDDEIEGKNRLFAYVMNLTPRWRIEWGGLLLFHDADGHVAEGYAPKFNALNIFKVPQWHSVSQVASYVTEPRLSITGWIRSARP